MGGKGEAVVTESKLNPDKLADAIARVATRSASMAEREMVLDAASAHLVLLRAPKDDLASAKAELGKWLVEHPGFYVDPTSGEDGNGRWDCLIDSVKDDVTGFFGEGRSAAAAIRDALARATGGDRG